MMERDLIQNMIDPPVPFGTRVRVLFRVSDVVQTVIFYPVVKPIIDCIIEQLEEAVKNENKLA